ncbi:MAG: hypothetical protein ACTSP4_00180 [Candidatus Hodarchaeales archaeon]
MTMRDKILKFPYVSWYILFLIGYLSDRLFTHIGVMILGVEMEGNELVKQLFINNDLNGYIRYEIVCIFFFFLLAFIMYFNDHRIDRRFVFTNSKMEKVICYLFQWWSSLLPLIMLSLLYLMGLGWLLIIIFKITESLPAILSLLLKIIAASLTVAVFIINSVNANEKHRIEYREYKEKNKFKALPGLI